MMLQNSHRLTGQTLRIGDIPLQSHRQFDGLWLGLYVINGTNGKYIGKVLHLGISCTRIPITWFSVCVCKQMRMFTNVWKCACFGNIHSLWAAWRPTKLWMVHLNALHAWEMRCAEKLCERLRSDANREMDESVGTSRILCWPSWRQLYGRAQTRKWWTSSRTYAWRIFVGGFLHEINYLPIGEEVADSGWGASKHGHEIHGIIKLHYLYKLGQFDAQHQHCGWLIFIRMHDFCAQCPLSWIHCSVFRGLIASDGTCDIWWQS